MAPSNGKKSKPTPQTGGPATPTLQVETPTTPQTIGEIHQAEYLASRPYQVLFEKKGWKGLSADEKTAYANFRLLESGGYEHWSTQEQKDFLKYCEKLKIPHPLPKPLSSSSEEVVFREQRKKIEALSPDEYREYKQGQRDLSLLLNQSGRFRDRARKLRAETREGKGQAGAAPEQKSEELQKLETLFAAAEQKLGVSFRLPTGTITEEDIKEETTRRIRIAELEGNKMPGIYEGDPLWDDVVPIPQDDGEKPLAAIAYTDEYAEAISYLRAIMATRESSPRALALTAHIIDLNPAHYTVWLFRASLLFSLHSPLRDELLWVNAVAVANEKNYQIWHHRQLLIDNLYPTLAHDRSLVLDLARSEAAFMAQMFDCDSKNYHVWSYRQYYVRKLSLFPSQCAHDHTAALGLGPEQDAVASPFELLATEALLQRDVRNNSAWAHRFFLVFSDPGHSTPDCAAYAHDPRVPRAIIDREIEWAQGQIRRAPMNQSGWNYVRGVVRKGGRAWEGLRAFGGEFVRLGDGLEERGVGGGEEGGEGEGQDGTRGEGGKGKEGMVGQEGKEGHGEGEMVTSTHALELLADIWAEAGEIEKADKALRLLGEKHDRVRRNYWEYRREGLRKGLKG